MTEDRLLRWRAVAVTAAAALASSCTGSTTAEPPPVVVDTFVVTTSTTPTTSSVATSSSPTSSPTTTLAASGTLPLSPWSSLVGDPVSVVPVQAIAPLEPRRLTIAGLDVDVPVSAVGVTSDGQLEIPDETEVGWYRLGSAPGQPGAVVLAGHVSWNRTTGPFFRLHELAAGAAIDLELVDGSTRRYVAIERAQYGKLMLPADRIWTRHGPETLVLITCGGAFNPDIRRYADNIVVYAAPQP